MYAWSTTVHRQMHPPVLEECAMQLATRDHAWYRRANPRSLPDRRAHTPVTARPRVEPPKPLTSPAALAWLCLPTPDGTQALPLATPLAAAREHEFQSRTVYNVAGATAAVSRAILASAPACMGGYITRVSTCVRPDVLDRDR